MSRLVLIVEDTPLNLELAQDILEAAGFTVIAASDADECESVLAVHRPDLILMDIGLPGKGGLRFTRELRAAPRTRDLLIVAMTAHAMAEDERRVMQAGCDGYLTKPIQTRTFAAQIEDFISAGRAVRIHAEGSTLADTDRTIGSLRSVEETGGPST